MPTTKTASHRPLPTTVAKALSQSLRQRRGDNDLTQEELASRARVSVQLIRRLEAGTSNPTLGTLHAIATALDASIVDLLAEAHE